KETDRLAALQQEISKLGGQIQTTADSLHLESSTHIIPDVTIATYQDHRMAMAFAPLALRVPLIIEDAEVVSKSYPTFWGDLARVGISGKMSENKS
ncbi:MAG: 3-phosphoshikimate 1-carboxyvinyltransferase, partial [Flavobacterium sp.]